MESYSVFFDVVSFYDIQGDLFSSIPSMVIKWNSSLLEFFSVCVCVCTSLDWVLIYLYLIGSG